jgi:hypothetical protein
VGSAERNHNTLSQGIVKLGCTSTIYVDSGADYQVVKVTG